MGGLKVQFGEQAFNPVYMPYYACDSRFLHLWGGAGSGKSVFAAQKILGRLLEEPGHRFILVRKVKSTIRQSQFKLIKDLIAQYNLGALVIAREWPELEFECPATGGQIISVGMDDREKLKSIAGPTGFWLEEPTELDKDDLAQVNLRLRGDTPGYKQLILTYNPIDANHWIRKTVHELPTVPLSDGRGIAGYNFTLLQTTFRDNKFLDAQYVTELEALASQDVTYHKIYNLGEWATPEHVIYEHYRFVQDWPEHPTETFYGLDFGYAQSPTALVQICVAQGEIFMRELIYEHGLQNNVLIDELRHLGVDPADPIYADSAAPAYIDEIYSAGFNVKPAEKAVKPGIDFCKRYTLNILDSSVNMKKEVQGYRWRKDRQGNVIAEPVKFNDHTPDAFRYALFTHGIENWREPQAFQVPSLKNYHERKRKRSIVNGYFEG